MIINFSSDGKVLSLFIGFKDSTKDTSVCSKVQLYKTAFSTKFTVTKKHILAENCNF